MKRIVDRIVQAVRDAVQEAAQAQAEQTKDQIDRAAGQLSRQTEETARENQLALERRLDEYMAQQEERLAALEAKLAGGGNAAFGPAGLG